MSIWTTPLGMGVTQNPVIESPYVNEYVFGEEFNPAPDGILTENGYFILTENGDYLSTE